jgi:hypothetical protein
VERNKNQNIIRIIMTDDEVLNDILVKSSDSCFPEKPSNNYDMATNGSSKIEIEFKQWQIGPNGTYRPAGLTRSDLPSGVYSFDYNDQGLYIKLVNVITDSLVILPDNASEKVLTGMKKFWEMEQKYRKHGLLYKRGILLFGPPGSGKTCTVSLLSKHLLESGGIVVMCGDPETTAKGLEAIRRIEPNRRIICIIEDIDEIIQKYGEHDLLALLDGENQVENIVMLGTTNYPERLGARIVNRPSRFDERIFVGMPSAAARRIYLQNVVGNIEELEQWVADTDQLSIAHLRELSAAVKCLDQDYNVVLNRLKLMKHKIKDSGTDERLGF